MGLGDVGRIGSSTEQVAFQTGVQAAPSPKVLDQPVKETGISAFANQKANMDAIAAMTIVFSPGTSAESANCRRLGGMVKNLISQMQCFSKDKQSSISSPSQDAKVPGSETIKEALSMVVKSLSNEVGKGPSYESGVKILDYGKGQLKLHDEWESRVKSYISNNNERISHSSTGAEKKQLLDENTKAQDLLAAIKENKGSLQAQVSDLEKVILSKSGGLSPKAAPQESSKIQGPRVHAFYRKQPPN